jgi:F-type H+-transporting ATPase subunit a
MSKNNFSVASEVIKKIDIFGYNLELTNTMLTTILVCGFLILVALLIRLNLNLDSQKGSKGFQNFLEFVGSMLENFIKQVSGVKKVSALMFALTGFFFSFIVLGSWVGLIPGVGQLETLHHGEEVHLFRAPTSDLNATIALSTIAFVLIQAQGIVKLKFGYLKKFFNFSSPLSFAVGLLELVSEISRLLSFSLRLFGNIFAGEVMLAIVASMSFGSLFGVPFGLPFPSFIIALEFFVALIQAYVFVALFLVFSNLAKEEAH